MRPQLSGWSRVSRWLAEALTRCEPSRRYNWRSQGKLCASWASTECGLVRKFAEGTYPGHYAKIWYSVSTSWAHYDCCG